jgi:hypothetical protein
MKNLIQKIAFVLAGVIATASIYANDKTIDLRNGYTAESYLAADNLDLIASVFVGEVILQKTEKSYVGKKTGRYLESAEMWNNIFDKICKSADKTEDNFITDIETKNLLDSIYKSMKEPIWILDDSNNQ